MNLKTIISASLLLFSSVSNAAIVLYTDEASFISNIGAHNYEDFESYSNGNYGTSATFGDLSFDSSPSSDILISTAGSFGAHNTTPGGSKFLEATAAAAFHDDMIMDLVSGTALTAWGANFTDLDFGTIEFLVDGLQMYNPTPGGDGNTMFVGFLATGGDTFSNVTLSVNDNTYGIDDVRTSIAQVPEPASIMLIGLGLIGMSYTRRKKNK